MVDILHFKEKFLSWYLPFIGFVHYMHARKFINGLHIVNRVLYIEMVKYYCVKVVDSLENCTVTDCHIDIYTSKINYPNLCIFFVRIFYNLLCIKSTRFATVIFGPKL